MTNITKLNLFEFDRSTIFRISAELVRLGPDSVVLHIDGDDRMIASDYFIPNYLIPINNPEFGDVLAMVLYKDPKQKYRKLYPLFDGDKPQDGILHPTPQGFDAEEFRKALFADPAVKAAFTKFQALKAQFGEQLQIVKSLNKEMQTFQADVAKQEGPIIEILDDTKPAAPPPVELYPRTDLIIASDRIQYKPKEVRFLKKQIKGFMNK